MLRTARVDGPAQQKITVGRRAGVAHHQRTGDHALQADRTALGVTLARAIAQRNHHGTAARIEGGVAGHDQAGDARVALAVHHTIGEHVVGDQGDRGVGAGQVGVQIERTPGLQGQRAAGAVRRLDLERRVEGEITVGLQRDRHGAVQTAFQEGGRHANRLLLALAIG